MIAFLKSRLDAPFFVQIGANDGIRFDDLFQAVTEYRIAGLVVEPMKDAFAKLVKNYAPYPFVTPVNFAIDVGCGERALFRVDGARPDLPDFAEGIASFDAQHHHKSGIPSESIVIESVQCLTFQQLMEQYDVQAVDLLQIDTEGHDGQILLSIDWARWKPACIRFEYASLKAEEREQVARLLVSHGYSLFRDQENAFALHECIAVGSNR
jgi:FkbM family methyltransferase